MGIGFYELLIILAIVLLVFGGRKLPEVAKGLGKALREFRKVTKGEDEGEELKKFPESPKEAPEKTASKDDA